MKEQIAIQTILRNTLSKLQSKNPSYSLRAFSKKLAIHHGALSGILNGKRRVSKKMAEKLLLSLKLDPQQRSEVLRLFQKESSNTQLSQSKYLQLNADKFRAVAEWEYFAILSLAKCHDFQSSAQWISLRLGVSKFRSQVVLERLIDLGMLTYNDKEELVRSHHPYRSFDDIEDSAIKKHHEETLDLAKESLHHDTVVHRDFTSVTIAINKNKISTAKEMIREFQDTITSVLEVNPRNEVYRLAIQLFPLTKIREGETYEDIV